MLLEKLKTYWRFPQVSRRSPRSIFPGQQHYPKKPVLITPELRRPHTAVEKRVKAILNTNYSKRPHTSDGRVERYIIYMIFVEKEMDVV